MSSGRTPEDEAIARANGGLLDLGRGQLLRDGEGELCTFLSYGPREPVYVNLQYAGISGTVRLPNSELRRA